jgi:YfiH family protein
MKVFEDLPEVVAVISEKDDGSCRLRPSGDAVVDAAVRENRRAFVQKIGVKYDSIVAGDLVHGNAVAVVSKADAGKIFAGVDGIVVNARGIFLSVTVADCLPIFLYDAKSKALGLLHAGWRGLEDTIIYEGVRKMVTELESTAPDIHAAIGPGIGACHFEVRDDVVQKFSEYNNAALLWREGKKYLDLKKIARHQLLHAGIPEKNIEMGDECTYCLSSKYFSYRRDKPEVLETMMAVLGIKE